MTFQISYHHAVVEEDIPGIAPAVRRRIRMAIEEKLTTHPEVFGKPLRRSLAGYWKLRIGDYRVVFRIKMNTVLILIIAHRSFVYRAAEKRQ